MGTRNRRRRAASARRRQARKRKVRDEARSRRAGEQGQGGRARQRTRDPADRGTDDVRFTPADLFLMAAAVDQDEDDLFDAMLDGLMELRASTLATEVQRILESRLAELWDVGWQPADVVRVAARRTTPGECTVLRGALAAQAASYEALGRRVAPGWMSQLDAADAVRWWHPARQWLPQVDAGWRPTIAAAARLAGLLLGLPSLPILTPPPSRWHDAMTADAPSIPSGLLDRVRALLAKAEATTFDAEAEAFTTKAQELMARHRIDRALLAATEPAAGQGPTGRRLGTDDPYAEAKALLLDGVASANGGRAVWSKGLGFSTVFAFGDELDAIEHLYTSLLVQATAALRREGSKHDRLGRSRTTRFRRSFLVAFAERIGERLRESVDAVVGEAVAGTDSTSVLPVLAARDAAVHDAATRAFPDCGSFSPRVTDHEGWIAGTVFADLADVSVGERLDRRAAS